MLLNTNNGPLTITISIGITQSIQNSSDPDTVESLLLRADQALYAAKKPGATIRSYLTQNSLANKDRH